MAFREYHKRWEFDLKSSPERLWPFIADTNRFNRDTGVPKIDVEKEEKRRPNARRKVRLSIYGMPVEWEEPFGIVMDRKSRPLPHHGRPAIRPNDEARS